MPTAAGNVPAPAISADSWAASLARRARRDGGQLAGILADAARRDVIAFSGGFPAAQTFPIDVIRALADDLLDGDTAAQVLQYSPTEGLPAARAAISGMIHQRQGLRPERVLVTSGGMDALTLVAKSMLDRGDHVLTEAPTYVGALMVFDEFEAQVTGVRLDDDGLDVDGVAAALAGGARPKFVYVIPDHQNPSGVSLSGPRRNRLVELCRRYGVLLVEDVAYRDLAFDGSAQPSLWSLAPDVVVQIGTFSKIFSPGTRLGWAIGPAPVLAAMAAAKQTTDQCAGALGQLLAARYVEQGHLEPTLVGARALYRTRAHAMLKALDTHMPPGTRWTRPDGGFFVWLTGPAGVDTTALVPKVAGLGVTYVPGGVFFPGGGGRECMRLCYSRTAEDDIDRGVAVLASALRAEQ